MSYTILSINLGNYGSTGKIIRDISELCENNGIRFIKAYRGTNHNIKKDEDDIIIGNDIINRIYDKCAYYTGFIGCFARLTTWLFLRKIKAINPDIIHLHNIHANFINQKMLFAFIKKNNYKVVWTLHDCWSFTGRCAHFDLKGCYKWKGGCYNCVCCKQDYPQTIRDRTSLMWKHKKNWFTGVKSLTIITPSKWLQSLVVDSYLCNYPIKVINNGIDLNIFKPRDSAFRKIYSLKNQYIILGVSFDWNYKKGLDVFIDLADLLPSFYKIVLVGTDDEVDSQLPKSIISIHRTKNQEELSKIYSASDVFLNPTREDTYPTVNMEALACGCPIVSFNTGGSPEILSSKTGIVLKENDATKASYAIRNICENRIIDRKDCLEFAKSFDKNDKFIEYLELYKTIIKD